MGYPGADAAPFDSIGHCPADPLMHPHGPNYISYALNSQYFGSDFSNSPPGGSSQLNIDTLAEYPRIIVIGDRARNWHMTRSNFDQYPAETYRHNDRANFVTVGGAVYSAARADPQDPPEWMWVPAK